MKAYKSLYIWWLSVLLVATGVFWSWHVGWVSTVWHEDVTFLTSAVTALFIVTQGILFRVAYYERTKTSEYVQADEFVHGKQLLATAWFHAEIMMAIGMLGTVIGLIYMLGKVFGSGAIDIGQLGDSIGLLWKGLGIALYTNAVGLSASLITKLNAYYIGWDYE